MEAKLERELVIPGWAGELSLEEARFIQEEIQKDRGLRRRWGFKGTKRVPLTAIAAKALPEDPDYARAHIRVEQSSERIKKARLRAKVTLERS